MPADLAGATQVSGGEAHTLAVVEKRTLSISHIPHQRTAEDNPTRLIPFTVTGGQSPNDQLLVTARSSKPAIVLNENIQHGVVSPGQRALQIQPVPEASGAVSITLEVRDPADPSEWTQGTFERFVENVNDRPVFTPGPDQWVTPGAGAQTVPARARRRCRSGLRR